MAHESVMSMTNKAGASILADRLQLARVRRGMTIQQMADACGLPKSTLESYMRAKSPKRPGLDALISISDGLGVSLDWLVGRSDENFSRNLTKKDYAIAAFSAAISVLNEVIELQKENSEPIIKGNRIAGKEVYDMAANAMFEFTSSLDLFDNPDRDTREARQALLDDLKSGAAPEGQASG